MIPITNFKLENLRTFQLDAFSARKHSLSLDIQSLYRTLASDDLAYTQYATTVVNMVILIPEINITEDHADNPE